MRNGPRGILLSGVAVTLLLFRFAFAQPHADALTDNERTTLSYYLVDTEFLTQCAANHPNAVQESRLLSPEIRVAILQLACERTGKE